MLITAAFSFSFFSCYLVAAVPLHSGCQDKRCIPRTGSRAYSCSQARYELTCSATRLINCLTLKAADELSVVSKSITLAGKQTLPKALV